MEDQIATTSDTSDKSRSAKLSPYGPRGISPSIMCPFVTRPQNFPVLLQLMPSCDEDDQLTFLRETNELLGKAQFNAAILRARSNLPSSFSAENTRTERDVITSLLSAAINMQKVSYGSGELLSELCKLIGKLLQPAPAQKMHYAYIYQMLSSLASCCTSKEQMQSHFQAFSVCVELLHIFSQPVATPSAGCFYFLPEDSRMAVDIPAKFIWPFRNGYTFIAWFKPELLGEHEKDGTLFRITGTTHAFECRLEGRSLLYRVGHRLTSEDPVQEESKRRERGEVDMGELNDAKWNYIAVSHGTSQKTSHFRAYVGNKELLGGVVFPAAPEDEELLEIKLFAEVSGAVSTCMILDSSVSMSKIREISKRLPDGLSELSLPKPDPQAKAKEALLSGPFLVLTPLYTFDNVVYDFHYTEPEESLTTRLEGNCGVLGREQYVDPIYNVTPLLQICNCLYVPQSCMLLESTLRLLFTYLAGLLRSFSGAGGCLRARREYCKFIKLLQYSLTNMDPRIVTTECVGVLGKMMRTKVDVRFDICAALMGSADMWINADPVVQRRFWELVQESFDSDQKRYSEMLNPAVLFEIMQNMGKVKECCALAEMKGTARKANYFLGSRYEILLPLVKDVVIFHKSQFKQSISTILRIIAKRPCHCLMRHCIILMKELCEKKSAAVMALESIHGLYVICSNSSDYTTDIKLTCLVLARAIMEKTKKLVYNANEVDLSVCSLFAKMYSYERLSQDRCKSVRSSMSGSSRKHAKSWDKERFQPGSRKPTIVACGSPSDDGGRIDKSASTAASVVLSACFPAKPRQRRAHSLVSYRELRRISRVAPASLVPPPKLQQKPKPKEVEEDEKAKAPLDISTEALLSPEGLQVDLKNTYFFLLDLLTDYRLDKQGSKSLLTQKVRIVKPKALKWIIKLARKVKDDRLSARVLVDLIAISESRMENRKLIALTEGLDRWLLRFEEALRSTVSLLPLYIQAIRFHASLVCIEFPDIPSFQFCLLYHQTHLLRRRSQGGGNMRFLWSQILEAYYVSVTNITERGSMNVWQQVFALTNSTFELVLQLIENKGEQNAESKLERIFGMPSATCMELIDGVFKLFSYFWKDTLSGTSLTAKERLEKLHPTLGEHMKLFGINKEMKTGFRDRAGVVFSLVQLLFFALRNVRTAPDLRHYLGLLVGLSSYLLIFVEYLSKTLNGAPNSAQIVAPFEDYFQQLIFAVIYKYAHADSEEARHEAILALSQILPQMSSSRAAESCKKSLAGLPLCGPVEPTAVKSFAEHSKIQVESVGEKIAGTGLKAIYEQIRKGCERTYKIIKHDSNTKQAAYVKIMNENANKDCKDEASAKAQLLSHFLRLELRRRSCAKTYVKLSQRAKQWRGAWRDKKLFDMPEGVAKLPYQVASHQFANSTRCLLTVRSQNVKYLDTQKFLKFCGDPLSRPEAMYTLLRSVINAPAFSSDEPGAELGYERDVPGLDLPRVIVSLGESLSPLVEVVLARCDSGFKEGCLASAVDCEIFTFLLAKPGKVMLCAEGGEGYIKFVFGVMKNGEKAEEEDKRLMFMYKHRTDHKLSKKWAMQDLSGVYKKQVVDTRTGLELVLTTGESVLLNFFKEEERESFCGKLLRLRDKLCKDRPDILFDGAKSVEKAGFTEAWCSHSMSTMDYLLALNMLSSRSFGNSSQYPVFPWILKDYTSDKLSTNSEEVYRDLTKSVGMIGDPDRAATFRQRILQEDITGIGHFNYGSHYSSPGIVLQFNVRLHPFYEGYVQFFTGYDDPNRMFHSMSESYRSICKDTSDVRELIPEFFSLPEVFINSECHRFGVRDDDKQNVDNILFPAWASKSPHIFVNTMRKALEHDRAGEKLHHWIDLIFGYQQRGKEAEKAHNVYPPLSTEPAKALLAFKGEMREDFRVQAFHWGQTPQQLFTRPHPPRLWSTPLPLCDKRSSVKIYRNKSEFQNELRLYSASVVGSKAGEPASSASNESSRVHGKILACRAVCDSLSGMRFLLVSASGLVIDGTAEVSDIIGHKGSVTCIIQLKSRPYDTYFKTSEGYAMANPTIVNNYPMAILKRRGAEQIVQAGYLNGTLRITSLMKMSSSVTLEVHRSPITCLKVDAAERLGITADLSGECVIHTIVDSTTWVASEHLCDHSGAVTWVDISDEMQLFATCSVDGTANLYTRSRRPKLIRSFRHQQGLPIHYVFLAQSPMPCLVIFSSVDSVFYSYSINGVLLYTLKESSTKELVSPVVARDGSFHNCLVFLRDSGTQIVVRRLPTLEKLKTVQLAMPATTLCVSDNQIFALLGHADGTCTLVGSHGTVTAAVTEASPTSLPTMQKSDSGDTVSHQFGLNKNTHVLYCSQSGKE